MRFVSQLPTIYRKFRGRVAAAAITCTTVCLVTALAPTQVLATDLRVTVDGIRGNQGKVMVALHMSKPDIVFPNPAGTIAAQWRAAGTGEMEFVFSGLPPGRFAIAVFHDENNNDVLDVNLIGIPKEGYAFSRNARGFAGPPSFDAAAVEIPKNNAVRATTATLGY